MAKRNGKHTPIKTAKNGRNAKGQFVPGSPGGPGRKPLAGTLAQHVRDIGSEIIDEHSGWTRLDAMIRQLYDDARYGRERSAEVVLSYGWGKPIQPIAQVPVWEEEARRLIAEGSLTREGLIAELKDFVENAESLADQLFDRTGLKAVVSSETTNDVSA